MKKDDLRKVPVKNYVILGVVIVVTMLILYYFYLWVDVYKDSKINIPIMDKYMTVINYNELEDYVVENPNTIVYVSVLENENIREFEKKFKNKYKIKAVNRDLLYMNITEDIKNKITSNTVGLIFPIMSRNRFSMLLKGISRGVKKLIIQLSYPGDEVGNKLISPDELFDSGVNPYADVFTAEEFKKIFPNTVHEFTGVDYIKF